MEPTYMICGQAAGVASSLAISNNIPVQQVNITQLQAQLTAQNQVLHPRQKDGYYILKESVSGIVMDNTDAAFTGSWSHSVAQGPFLMYSYQFAQQASTETAKAVYNLNLPESGLYEVQIMYSPASNRSKAARVIVSDNQGANELFVDMSRPFTAPEYWFSLGIYNFPKTGGKVTISNQGNGGIVIADGVRLIKKSDISSLMTPASVNTSMIYPNPVDDTLCISNQDEVLSKSVSVYNPSGQRVKTAVLADNCINVSDLTKGYYILRVGDKKEKFLKN